LQGAGAGAATSADKLKPVLDQLCANVSFAGVPG